jgi:hypothetical protein
MLLEVTDGELMESIKAAIQTLIEVELTMAE